MSESRARVWALLGAVVLASACGGGGDSGGGSSTTPPPPPPPPPAAPEEFLVAGLSQADGPKSFVVVDPAQPAVALLTVTAADSLLEVSNLSFDTGLRRATFGNATMVYYVRNRQLHQASLRKSHPTRTQRISSLASACTVDDWHPLSYATGDDGWVEVTEAGPDGDCSTAPDNRKAFVRNASPITTEATMLPAGVRVLAALPDPATNMLAGFIARDSRATPSRLTFYSPTLTYVGDVAGGAGGSSVEFMSFVPDAQLRSSAYVKVNGFMLGRLSWSATSATLSSTGQSFAVTTSDRQAYFSDSEATYFADGLNVRRIDAAGATTTLATLDTTEGTVVRLKGLTSGHVVIQQETTSGAARVFTIAKQGGTPLRLSPIDWLASVVGLNGDDVVYATKPGWAITPGFRRIRADGSNQRQINFGSFPYENHLRPVFSSTVPYSSGQALDALVWCELAASESSCRGNGAIKSYDVRSGTITTLGNLSHSGTGLMSSLNVGGWGRSGRPTVLTVTAVVASQPGFVTDFYMVQPGTPNSLVRLTTNIP
jgi:hypothetical protein